MADGGAPTYYDKNGAAHYGIRPANYDGDPSGQNAPAPKPVAADPALQQQLLNSQTSLKTLQAQIDAQKLAQSQNTTPGYQAVAANSFEQQAGVTPPGFQGMVDPATGQLLSQFTNNPFSGADSQMLQQEATSTGPSQWAKSALGQQGFEESQARGNAGLQNQQAQSQAMSSLMRQGGLGGGARTSLARSGARDALTANQGVANQGVLARYGINQTDAQRKQSLLDTGASAERAASTANIGTLEQNAAAKAQFDANRYNQQMQAWAAKQGADATRAAGSGGGGKK